MGVADYSTLNERGCFSTSDGPFAFTTDAAPEPQSAGNEVGVERSGNGYAAR